jgi:hypothetical protein
MAKIAPQPIIFPTGYSINYRRLGARRQPNTCLPLCDYRPFMAMTLTSSIRQRVTSFMVHSKTVIIVA